MRFLKRIYEVASTGPALNGMSPISAQWVQVLQTLTSCDNLRFLTMLTWSEVIKVNKLLRRKKAWCPQCFQEWRQNRQIVYEPLLWTLSIVNICPYHQQALVSLCWHCQESLPFFSQVARPGYCLRCMRWLGNDLVASNAETIPNDTDTLRMHRLQASVIGELLAAAPKLLGPPSKEQFTNTLNRYLNEYARGNINVLARLLKIPMQALHRYLRQGNVPYFDSLMQLCNGMLITPLDFFTTSSLPSRDLPQFVLDRLPILSSGKRKPVTEDDVQRMRQALETVLEVEEENPFPFPDLHQVAQRIGYSVNTLCKYCSDLCHAIVTRKKKSWSGDDACRRMRQTLENALVRDERLSLEAIAQQLACTRSVLYQHFPNLSQSVVTRYQERFNQERIRQRLHEVLSSSEKTPGMRELARQLGCNDQFLENNFPDLCKQIALRRRTERRKQREEQVTRTYTEIHQTVLVLHQQGIYPSSRQVTKQLNKPHILWNKEGREAWLLALEELGYPTSHLKRYT